jgi:hypothetical protein
MEEVDPSTVSVGCTAPVVAGFAFYLVVGTVSSIVWQLLYGEYVGDTVLLPSFLLAIIFGFLYAQWKKIGLLEDFPRKREEEIRRAEREASRAAASEAQEATGKARSTLEQLNGLAVGISSPLEEALEILKDARSEYEERAFASFWDRVERAAIQLANFQDGVRDLISTLSRYRKLLEGRIHNFPDFVVAPESIPDPRPVLQEFRDVARLGEKDYQFAMIWEQRKTREVLIAGFHTLGEAVQNLGRSLERSMFELGTAITVDVGRAIEEGKADRTRQLDVTERQVKLLEEIRDDSKRRPS